MPPWQKTTRKYFAKALGNVARAKGMTSRL